MASTAGRFSAGSRRARPQVLIVALAMALGCWYALAPPHTPDLAAQVARLDVARRVASATWWVGWFGGLQLSNYSVLSPRVMATLGVGLTGGLSVVASGLAMMWLVRGTRQATLATVTFLGLSAIDVAAGRLTFAMAFALVVVAMACLRHRSLLAVPACLLAFLLSPLAGLFAAIAILAVALTDRARRANAVWCVLALAVAAGILQLLFPGTGPMPTSLVDLVLTVLTAGGVAFLTSARVVRVAALMVALLAVAVTVIPNPVGTNIDRACWLAAAPALLVTSRHRGWLLAVAALAATVWPVTNAVGQLIESRDPSASQAFYPALVRELVEQTRRAGPASLGERLEVVDPRSHWSSALLSDRWQLARGWFRQADIADNPVFYDGDLTPETYRQWLQDLSVGWVARPHAPLDFASRVEAQIVDSHPAYLQRVWSNADWDLYRVVPARPLVRGAAVIALTPTSIRLRFARAGSALVTVRWSRFLHAPSSEPGSPEGCVQPSADMTTVTAPAAGDYTLLADVDAGPQPCVGPG